MLLEEKNQVVILGRIVVGYGGNVIVVEISVLKSTQNTKSLSEKESFNVAHKTVCMCAKASERLPAK